MTNFIKFTALSGAIATPESIPSLSVEEKSIKDIQPVGGSAPPCYLLEIDEAKILLDCGWTDAFNTEDLQGLARLAKNVDAVLVSHPTIHHLGALAYAQAQLGLSCPIYGTLPVLSLGQTALEDALLSRKTTEQFDTFTMKDIKAAFDKSVHLRYSQPTALQGLNCQGITVTAFPAGYSLGGTVWKIKKDTDEIVYAVNYNQGKERVLGTSDMNQGGSVAEALLRPTLLITGAHNFMVQQQWTRKTREQAFFDTVIPSLRAGNPVMIPVDAGSRAFEVAFVLDNQWNKTKSQVPIVFMSHTAVRTMQFAKSMIEWMGEDVNAAFSKNRDNPIEFRSIRSMTSLADLSKVNPARVVMASLGSMDYGFSRDLLLEQCKNPKLSIILPTRGQPGTLQRLIYDEWVKKTGWTPDKGDSAPPAVQMDSTIALTLRRRVPLQGEELLAHLRELQMKREQEEAEAAVRLREEMLALEDVDESDEDERPEAEDLRNPLLVRFDAYVKEVASSKLGGGAFFRGQQSFRMFPAQDNRRRFDDYGEIINPEDYIGKEFHYANMEAIRTREDKMETDQKEEQESKIPEIPTKVVEEEVILELKCNVRYVDFEAEADGRSIRHILPQIMPKKMIIIQGLTPAADAMIDFCKSTPSFTQDVVSAKVNETINVSMAENVYQLKLTDALVSSLKMVKLGDYELAYVDGIIRIPPEGGDAVLDVGTAQEALVNVKQQPSVIIGDLRLNEFRKRLRRAGIKVELNKGVLVCNGGQVCVRKGPEGKLIVEGNVGPDYFRVRDLLYQTHAVL